MSKDRGKKWVYDRTIMRIRIVGAMLSVDVLGLCMTRVCIFATVMIHGTLAVFLVDWITFDRAITRT